MSVLKVGDHVEKVGGDYQASGTVRAVFLIQLQDGDWATRVVVQFDAIPLCHILTERQLQKVP